jgi:putative oxidoreductase
MMSKVFGNIRAWILDVAFESSLAWNLPLFLALVFTLAGSAKLMSGRGVVEEFRQIGFGQWLRYFTGILEVSGAIGVLIPKTRFWAALQIAAVMTGATVINLSILKIPALALVTAVLLALALALAWLRPPSSARRQKVFTHGPSPERYASTPPSKR